MSRKSDQKPASVSRGIGTTQAGSIDRWWWVEPAVWTERMLTALQEGVKGGKPLLCRARARRSARRPCSGVSVLKKYH